jgi:hypothetical protein
MKKAAPVALNLAPMVLKREEEEMELLKRQEEQHLERRLSQKAKNFWNKVGQGVKKAAPVALSLAPLVLKREEEQMELFKRQEEQHLERRISQKAKNFWGKVGQGVSLLTIPAPHLLTSFSPTRLRKHGMSLAQRRLS